MGQQKLLPLFLNFLSNPKQSQVRDTLMQLMSLLARMVGQRGSYLVLEAKSGVEKIAIGQKLLFPAGNRIKQEVHVWGESPRNSIETPHAPLHASILQNSLVTDNGYCQTALQGNNIYFSERYEPSPWLLAKPSPHRPGNLVAQRGGLVVVRRKLHSSQERGIFVGSRSSSNWSHWLVNFLPSVYLLRFLPDIFEDYPLFLPETIPDDAHWTDLLNFLLQGRSTVRLSKTTYCSVDNLIWIDPPVYDTPFSAAENQRASISLHKEAMQGFRELLIAKFASENSPNLPKKIFLARQGNRRKYNQSDAIELASDFGIVPVFVENLTLEEKIRLFLQSELIIGPEGSGFANTLFTTPNTRLLTWWPDKLGPGANYNPNLASVSGATYYFTPSSWCQKTPGEETYILNLSLLKSALEVLSQEPL